MSSNPKNTQNEALRVIVNFHYNPETKHCLTMRIIGDSLIDIMSLALAVECQTIALIATPIDTLSKNVPDVLVMVEHVESNKSIFLDCPAVKRAIYAAVHLGADWATDGIPPSFTTKVYSKNK